MGYRIEDRDMVIDAVLNGVLSADHITDDELTEMEDAVFELIASDYTPFATWDTIQ